MQSLVTFVCLLSITINLVLFSEYLAATDDNFRAVSTFPVFQNPLFRLHHELMHKTPRYKLLALSLNETSNYYIVKTDLPEGMSKDNVFITIPTNDTLTIAAHWNFSQIITPDTAANSTIIERYDQKVAKTFSIPRGVKRNEILASLKNGTLTISIPKPHAALCAGDEIVITDDNTEIVNMQEL